MNDLHIYTDGGCRKNPGLGSWAMIVYNGVTRKGSKHGVKAHTTNNEMELTAILEVMKWLHKHGLKARVYTDSAYCCNGYNNWMEGWKKNMWRTSSKKTPIKNLELWREVYHLSKEVDMELIKVKGHSNNSGNNAADALCNVAMDEYELNNKF